ncbi:hypothetical protein GN958_ATG22027 [Phytophthora infestans]|uniref:Uncharacterized protein n=1 Tax=Phytophthora infestans TaxID=4787 RepID=A0A8S9TPX0_PHYIN|nr:hypothetical protein GN958_ATG22027 [Phytophthora infestans]
MRELLQQNEKIVLALRDMSLNPDVLESQLGDHELRGFYQKLIDFLQSKKKDTGYSASSPSHTTNDQPQRSLDEQVLAAASLENGALWMRLVDEARWAAYRDALIDDEDPELLLFHAEEEDSVNTLKASALEAITDLVQPPASDEKEVLEVYSSAGASDEDAEMLILLSSVHFGPSLMIAMNQGSYYVQALQDPILMASMQQLMANPKDFAITATLQEPVVREFFLKLIALSLTEVETSVFALIAFLWQTSLAHVPQDLVALHVSLVLLEGLSALADVLLRQLRVLGRALLHELRLLGREVAQVASGNTRPELTRGHLLAFRYDGSSRNDGRH